MAEDYQRAGAGPEKGVVLLSGFTTEECESNAEERYSSLTSREKDVIERRFAIGWKEKQTLEEVGGAYKLTRERIRQLESKALKKLRSPIAVGSWEGFIRDKLPELIDAVFGGQALVRKPSKISGEFGLSVAIVHGTEREFLERHAQRFEGRYWIKPGFNVRKIQTARNRLRSVIGKGGVLPVSIREASEALGESPVVIEAAVSALEGSKVYMGWIIGGNATVRKKRAVHILNLFVEGMLIAPAGLWQIKVAYWRNYPNDKCSGRDLWISLQEYPRHFINLRELGWDCLGIERGIQQLRTGFVESSVDIPEELYAQPIKNSGGLANNVYEVFERNGPLRLAEASEIFQASFPQYKPASMYPMLVYFAVFQRLAPGIFGIQAHLRNPGALRKARKIMLTRRDLELYLLSCAAGLPRLRYPLWDPEMERLWAYWLSERRDLHSLGALLSVARISEWEVSQSERSQWEVKKKVLKGRIVGPPFRFLSERRIDAAMLTTALAAASVFGVVNWMYLNQALGWRIETSRVAVVMAVLIRIGALKPIGAWNESHVLTERGRQIARSILGRSAIFSPDPAKNMLDWLEEFNESEGEWGWAGVFRFDELVLQIAEVGGCPENESDGLVEDDSGDDLKVAYEGFMGDALRELIGDE